MPKLWPLCENNRSRLREIDSQVAVHPTLPYAVTCSDDMTIKLWDWDNNWECKMTYEGHSHYVMQV